MKRKGRSRMKKKLLLVACIGALGALCFAVYHNRKQEFDCDIYE